MSDSEIAQLVQIAQMLRDRDLGELAERHDQRRKAQSARKTFAEQARAEDEAAVDHLGYRKDVELPRRVWRERRIYALSHYEARAAAMVETQKRVAAKSFGRAMVLEQIADQLQQDGKARRRP
jgi:hypothetical protein